MKAWRVNMSAASYGRFIRTGVGMRIVDEIEIQKKTEKSVILADGTRNGLATDWHRYFFSREDAIEFCRRKLLDQKKMYEDMLLEIRGHLKTLDKGDLI
jgi:hypothetical protein